MAATPQSTAERLLRYGYQPSTIVAHINRDFGYRMDSDELLKIHQRMPKGKRERATPQPYEAPDKPIKTPPADPLLRALAAYKLKYEPVMDAATRATYEMVAR
jgi:hypothetical protein